MQTEREILTEAQITRILSDDGWAITSTVTDPGDYKTESRHAVTITRNGQAIQTPYTMGAAHRVWTKSGLGLGLLPRTEADRKRLGPMRPGERVGYVGGRITLHQESCLIHYTEPATPTLADVMYSLVMDASGVRHGQEFDEWASDCGYDTDSREAERIYNACTDIWRGLARCGADLDRLDELFQDY